MSVNWVCADCIVAEVGRLALGEETCLGPTSDTDTCQVCGNRPAPGKLLRQPKVWPPPRAPDAMLDDIVLLCGKVFADHEENERVLVDDLVELRDSINELRHTVAAGAGYKAVPKLVRPEKS